MEACGTDSSLQAVYPLSGRPAQGIFRTQPSSCRRWPIARLQREVLVPKAECHGASIADDVHKTCLRKGGGKHPEVMTEGGELGKESLLPALTAEGDQAGT